MASAFILGFAAVPRDPLPCAEPQDLQTFLAGAASLCGAIPGAGPASVQENPSGVSGKGAYSSEGNLGAPKLGEGPK